MQKSPPHNIGFSLIELIIILAIISVVSLISTNAYTGYIDSTKNSLAENQIRGITLLINDYALNYGEYPSSLKDIGSENLKDPWGNPYIYLNLQANKNYGNSDSFEEYNGGHHGDNDGHGSDTNISEARKDGRLVPINTNFDLCSFGKDGDSKAPLRAKVSHDDIIYANDGGYIGLAREF